MILSIGAPYPKDFSIPRIAVLQALITVSNHVAALDDPLLTSALVPAGALLQPSALRWTLCATNRCFTSAAATAFFRAAKVPRFTRVLRKSS